MSSPFIKFPERNEDIGKTKHYFYEKYKFQRCIGAINYTHIQIRSSGGRRKNIHRNCKQYFFNEQEICNVNFKFLNIVTM